VKGSLQRSSFSAMPELGKSRLIAESTAGIALPPYRVVGYEPEQLGPLAAASDLLRKLTAAPGHGAALDELAFGAATATAPARVFEAAHRALTSMGPALLVVDDIQWVDELSLALVHYLVRAAESSDTRLCLLAAGRNVGRALAFADDIARLLDDRSGVIDVDPLPAQESLELALSLDPNLRHETAVELCTRSGGIPFRIETLVGAGGAPVEAGRLLTARLRDAGPDAVALLALMAVVARPVLTVEAATLLGWPAERVEAAANDLATRGVGSRSHVELRISHDLLRAAAYAEVPKSQRRDLHIRIAEWLQQTAQGDLSQLQEALGHRLAAGETPIALAVSLVSTPQRRRLGSDGLTMLMGLADAADRPVAADSAMADAQVLGAGIAALASELGDQRLALQLWSAFAPSAARELRFGAFLVASKAALELGWDHTRRAHELLREAVASATSEEELVSARA
jgi:predicted ATPase